MTATTRASLLVLVGVSTLTPACYSQKSQIESSLPHSQQINWPQEYEPSQTDFFVHNEVDIAAPPEVVWDIFVQAEQWPQWHDVTEGIELLNATDGKLALSTVFTWYPAGKFTSTVVEFEAPHRLAWYAEDEDRRMTVHHAWLFIPTEQGCKVVSDESQNGPRTKLEKAFAPRMVSRAHEQWLVGLKALAEKAVATSSSST